MRSCGLLLRPAVGRFAGYTSPSSSVARNVAGEILFGGPTGGAGEILASSDVALGAFSGSATAAVGVGASSIITLADVVGSATAQVIVEASSGVVLGTITGNGTFTVGAGVISASSSVVLGSIEGAFTAFNAGMLTIPARVLPKAPPKPHGPHDHRWRAMRKAWNAWAQSQQNG